MADISSITLPNGTTYDIKDTTARKGQPIYYATCSTAAGTAAKAATTTNGDFTLATGAMVRVKFTNADTYNGTSTLNVDSKGAKNIVRVGTTVKPRYNWTAGEVVDFVYDGTNFVMLEGGTATTTYYGITALSSATNSTSEVLAATPKAVKAAYDLADGKQDPISAGTGISISSDTVSLASGVVTASSAGPTAAVTGNEGTTVAIPRITVDTYGRVTGLTSYNLTNKNTTYTAATSAPGNVASSSAVGTSTNYARQDHTHGITLATGDNNGQVKIAGTNVDVKGLGDVAYTDDGSTSVTSHDLSGSVLSFTAVNPQPVKSLVLNLEPTQSGTGDPSPSNIRPITGYDSVTIVRGGKNLLDLPTSGGRTNSGITWTYNADGTVTASGTATGNSWSYATPTVLMLPQGTYTASVESPFGLVVAVNSVYVYNGSNNTYTFTLDEKKAVSVNARVANGSTVNATTGIMLEVGSTATEYEAPQATTYPISLSSAGTVYGGTLDVTTGELVVDRGFLEFDGTENWLETGTVGTQHRFYLTLPTAIDLPSTSYTSSLRSSCFNDLRGSGNSGTWGVAVLSSTMVKLLDMDGNFSGASALKTWIADNYSAGTPVQFTYPLGTPITYQLTPTEVTTLLGQNTIWMDAEGTIEATYEDVVSPIKYAEVGELGTAATHNANDEVVPDATLPTGVAVYNHTANRTFYGTCSTAAATAAKVVVLEDGDGFELKPGVVVGVKFSATNTANNMTLNVNNTGAIGISYIAGTRYTGATANITGSNNYIIYYMYDGTYWTFFNHSGNYSNNSNTVPAAQCETAAATAAKAATCTNHTLTANTYLHFNIRYANTAKSALTMNVDSSGAKPIYINGAASSSSNYTLPAGTYIAFYNGTYWDFRTDGTIGGLGTLSKFNHTVVGTTADITF